MLDNIHAPIGGAEYQPGNHLLAGILTQINQLLPNAQLRYHSDPIFTLTRALQMRQNHSPGGDTISPPDIDWSEKMSGNPIFEGVRNRLGQLGAKHAVDDGGLLKFAREKEIPLSNTDKTVSNPSSPDEPNIIAAQIQQWLTEHRREFTTTTDLTVVAREIGLSENDFEGVTTTDLKITNATPNVVADQVYTHLIQAGVPLKLTSDLPEIAREIVIPEIVRTYSKMSESFEQILDRLVEMGFKYDDQLKMNVTRAINDQLNLNDPPSPVETDPVDVVADWLFKTANQVHDKALGLDQPAKASKSETLVDMHRMSLSNIIQSTSQKCRQILQKTGKLLRATGGAGVEFGKGLGTSIGVAAEQIPVALGLDRLAKKIGGTVTKVFEKQSQNEMGFRTQLARLLTGKASIPRPTFTWKHKANEEDWAKKSLENAAEAIEWLRTHIPEFRLIHVKLLLGFLVLPDKPNNHAAALRESRPVVGEITGLLQMDDGLGHPKVVGIQPVEEKTKVPPLSSQEFQFLANGGYSPNLLKALVSVHDARLNELGHLKAQRIENKRIENNTRITAENHARIDTKNSWTPERELQEREYWGDILPREFPQLTKKEQSILLDLVISNLQVPGYNPARGNGIRQMAIVAVLEVINKKIKEQIQNIDNPLASDMRESTKDKLIIMKNELLSYKPENILSLLQEKGLV